MEYLRNSQWVVNDAGLQSTAPGAPYEYHIAANRLLESADYGQKMYDWPMHICEKTWVDRVLFLAAFRKAVEVHKSAEVDTDMLEVSVDAALQSAR